MDSSSQEVSSSHLYLSQSIPHPQQTPEVNVATLQHRSWSPQRLSQDQHFPPHAPPFTLSFLCFEISQAQVITCATAVQQHFLLLSLFLQHWGGFSCIWAPLGQLWFALQEPPFLLDFFLLQSFFIMRDSQQQL